MIPLTDDERRRWAVAGYLFGYAARLRAAGTDLDKLLCLEGWIEGVLETWHEAHVIRIYGDLFAKSAEVEF